MKIDKLSGSRTILIEDIFSSVATFLIRFGKNQCIICKRKGILTLEWPDLTPIALLPILLA